MYKMSKQIHCTECATSHDSPHLETSKLKCGVSKTKTILQQLETMSFSLGEKAPQAPLFAYGKAKQRGSGTAARGSSLVSAVLPRARGCHPRRTWEYLAPLPFFLGYAPKTERSVNDARTVQI